MSLQQYHPPSTWQINPPPNNRNYISVMLMTTQYRLCNILGKHQTRQVAAVGTTVTYLQRFFCRGKWTNDMQDFWLIIYTVPLYHAGCRGCSWWDWFKCTYYKIVPVLQLHFVIVSLVIWKKSQYALVFGMWFRRRCAFFLKYGILSVRVGVRRGIICIWPMLYLPSVTCCGTVQSQYFKTFNTLKSCLFHNEISGRKYLITISSMICSVMRSLDVNSDIWFHIHLITNIAVIQ